MSLCQRSRSIRPVILFISIVILLLASTSLAVEKPILLQGYTQQLVGGPADGAAKASCDSVLVMGPWGSGAPFNGQFQAPANDVLTGQWNGWTSRDNTLSDLDYWHVDTYNAENLNGHGAGNLAAWCGTMDFESCGSEDAIGGYGNSINETLIWTVVVADPLQPAEITIDAWLNHNVEEVYDSIQIGYLAHGDVFIPIMPALDGIGENVHLLQTFTCQPEEYGGELGNTITVAIKVESDSGYSDEDCFYPSNGAVQIDDITVTVDNGSHSYFEDFESGTLGQWEAPVFIGVGDFAHIDSQLEAIVGNPCYTNRSSQVLFVDDGVVVPGTGGSQCINWCYGPGGYVVNSTGGLAGPDYHLDNSILSPVMPWPDYCATGGLFEYDVYDHEPLDSDSAGIFNSWDVRSTASQNPADIEDAPWVATYMLYWYYSGYRRASYDVSSDLVPGAKYVQVRLSVIEYGYHWGWAGNDATPAPYFDNVRVIAFDRGGPSMSTGERDLANDGFPASGTLDAQNPAGNSVRFDMARNIATSDASPVDPGDSVVITVNPLREDATLAGPPVMHYKIKPNILFDPYRSAGLPMEGTVEGSQVVANGSIVESRFCFDLPDTGLFFPGDEMHYYFTATDEVSGGGFETSILPADTLGFSGFDNALSYDQSFVFRALPTVQGIGGEEFNTPNILFWDDLGYDSMRPHWHMALSRAMGAVGAQYDVYYTNAATSGLDNGLGRRATVAQLQAYDIIFYASGSIEPNLSRVLTGSGEAPNLDLFESWLSSGDKSLFLAGDDLASSLAYSGAQGSSFLNDWMGVSVIGYSLIPYIGNRTSPSVGANPGNLVFGDHDTWIAYGGCPSINNFDVVEAVNGGVQLAEFLDPVGNGGQYPYSAATLMEIPEFGAKVISLPYDLSVIWDDPDASKSAASMPARAQLVRDVLQYFGVGFYYPVPVPDAEIFSTKSYPNPFNPITRIDFNMPQKGKLKLRIFNIRGEMVRTLVDGIRLAGPGSVTWDGTDGSGSNVSAGVYFYEARIDGNVEVGKMALIK